MQHKMILTVEERELAMFATTGARIKESAKQLLISVKTVKNAPTPVFT